MKTSFQKFMASEAVKVELGEVKVDLALVDDANAQVVAVSAKLDKALKNARTLAMLFNEINRDAKSADKTIEMGIKAAKDLGVDISSFKSLRDKLKNYSAMAAKFESALIGG